MKKIVVIILALLCILALSIFAFGDDIGRWYGRHGHDREGIHLHDSDEAIEHKIERINEKVEEGYLSREEADKLIAAIESGDYTRGICDSKDFEAIKAEKIEAIKAMLENGEITQEKADALIESMENGFGIHQRYFDEKKNVTVEDVQAMLEAGKITKEKAEAWIDAINSGYKGGSKRGYHRRHK